MTTVLVSSAGRRGQLVECFRESGRSIGAQIRVIAVDLRPTQSAACQLADRAIAVPPVANEGFVPALLHACREESVRLLVPTIDTELRKLSEHRREFATYGIDVAVSSPEVVALAGDKERTARVLRNVGVNTPRTLSAAAFNKEPRALSWPVILKPRGGSSSIGIARPASLEEALTRTAANPDLLVQELWSGREYTVNMFFDRSGQLRCAVPHLRMETRAGEVSKGRTEDVAVLRGAAKAMASALLGARGALCFQAIVDDHGGYAVFEINARFGGGYPLAHRAGARFAQWLLEEALGLPCSASDVWQSGVTMLRYDAAVFLDE